MRQDRPTAARPARHAHLRLPCVLLLAGITGLLTPGPAGAAGKEAESLADAVFDPALIASMRYRYEFVDQDGFVRDANASTLRLRLGVRTREWRGFSFTVEGEGVAHLGPERFNDTVNGRTAFPVVADPEDVVLNRVFGRWQARDWLAVDAGRQALNLDNQRFIGSVGWRQNDQTMDSAGLVLTPASTVRIEARYVWRVNRIFGPDSPVGVWKDTDIVLLNGRATLAPGVELGAYAYLLDIPAAAVMSSQTYGARLKGERGLAGPVSILYRLEYARQSDRARNPADFALDYWRLEAGLKAHGAHLKLGLERLEGKDGVAFQTPLATLHAFNGWADRFLVTPPAGLEDRFVDLGWTPQTQGWARRLKLGFIYHRFSPDRGSSAYGREYDALVSGKLPRGLVLTAKFARYEAGSLGADTSKFWLMAAFAF